MAKGGHVRRRYYDEMVIDEGEWCKICKKRPPTVYLEIDHKDKNTRNNARSNRQFLCRSDNRKKNHRGRGRRKKTIGLPVSALEEPKITTAEMQKNSMAEPRFCHWLYSQVKQHGRITESDAIYAGAEYAHCSPITTKRYLMKACSSTGLFVLLNDSLLDCKVVMFRTSAQAGITAELIAEAN